MHPVKVLQFCPVRAHGGSAVLSFQGRATPQSLLLGPRGGLEACPRIPFQVGLHSCVAAPAQDRLLRGRGGSAASTLAARERPRGQHWHAPLRTQRQRRSETSCALPWASDLRSPVPRATADLGRSLWRCVSARREKACEMWRPGGLPCKVGIGS